MNFILLKEDLAIPLVNYLNTKPYNEVKQLIDGILDSKKVKNPEIIEEKKEQEALAKNPEEKKIIKGK